MRPQACELGPTTYCVNGQHGKCEYRPDGYWPNGNEHPECYVTKPAGRRHKGTAPIPDDFDRSLVLAEVIRPSHIYRCDCECHTAEQIPTPGEQLDLFTMEVAT